jgi:hypothetical protein
MFRNQLLAAVVLLLGQAARAEDSPRDLLVRAVGAQGGEARLTRGAALYGKIKGRYFSSQGALVGEAFHQYPGYYKDVIRLLDATDQPAPFFYIITPDKGYVGPKDSVTEITGDALNDLLLGSYKDHLRDLLIGLLHDRSAIFTALPNGEVHDRPARGLHYQSDRFGSMDLYFDKANDFLVKMAYDDRSPTLGGRRPQPRKVVILIDAYREPDYKAWSGRALKAAGHKSDPASLLQIVRRQTLDAAGRKRLHKLIVNLGDDSFEVREKATAELMAAGLAALPYLQEASKYSDPEVRRRARHCLTDIDKPGKREALRDGLVGALQLLELHKPAGTAEALLAYLPQAKDELVRWEVLNTLEAVAKRDGKPDPAVLAALESKDTLLRQTAAGLLGRDKGVFARRTGRRIDVTGVKLPTKFRWMVNEEKNTEWEITEFRFYNAFDKSAYAKP